MHIDFYLPFMYCFAYMYKKHFFFIFNFSLFNFINPGFHLKGVNSPYLGLVARKLVFGVSDKIHACSSPNLVQIYYSESKSGFRRFLEVFFIM